MVSEKVNYTTLPKKLSYILKKIYFTGRQEVYVSKWFALDRDEPTEAANSLEISIFYSQMRRKNHKIKSYIYLFENNLRNDSALFCFHLSYRWYLLNGFKWWKIIDAITTIVALNYISYAVFLLIRSRGSSYNIFRDVPFHRNLWRHTVVLTTHCTFSGSNSTGFFKTRKTAGTIPKAFSTTNSCYKDYKKYKHK